jgi:AraC-like DNA-binding protein
MQHISIKEYKANDMLKNLVSSYYIIENQTISHNDIPPLGFPVIKFHLRNNINTFYSNYSFPVSEIMIVGQLTKFAKVKQEQNTSMIGVNLKPTTLYKLFKTPASYFTDKGIPAAEFFKAEIYQLHQQLLLNMPDDEKVELLNRFFLSFLDKLHAVPDKFDMLIDKIIEKGGNVSTSEIYNVMPVSERTLQRYFLSYLGINIKTFQRILRNLHFFRHLHEPDLPKFSDFLTEIGYYDYSHFAKDFKLMTGIPPKEYFSGKQEFSKLLTQL